MTTMEKMVCNLQEENRILTEANAYFDEQLNKIGEELERQTRADSIIAGELEKLDFDKLGWEFSPVHDGDGIRKAEFDGFEYTVCGWRNMYLYNCYTTAREILELKKQVDHYKDMYESLKGILNQKGF